ITAVLDAYRARQPRTCAALREMRALAESMASALVAGDVDLLGRLVGAHWEHQRALHPAITTPRIDAILDAAMRAGALGGKALGASGGGCVLVVARDEHVEAVRAAVAALGVPLPFTIDQRGCHVSRDAEGTT
ncbi:MAG TPA: hypothetical protein VFY16_02670, partial [Gemmatimonadaceae bacterium]|nr:hypothetical protein [Gemmatimonadaceae bacterium]